MTIYGSDYLFTGNDNLDLVNVSQANQVRAYLSENVSDEDVVFGSPALIWGLQTMKRSDFLTALVYNDKTRLNFINIDKTRFRNELSLDNTRFVILDPLAEKFAPLVLEGMDQWLLQFHQWPIVFSTEDISVFENPLFRTD